MKTSSRKELLGMTCIVLFVASVIIAIFGNGIWVKILWIVMFLMWVFTILAFSDRVKAIKTETLQKVGYIES